jgi:hypothetical protein
MPISQSDGFGWNLVDLKLWLLQNPKAYEVGDTEDGPMSAGAQPHRVHVPDDLRR